MMVGSRRLCTLVHCLDRPFHVRLMQLVHSKVWETLQKDEHVHAPWPGMKYYMLLRPLKWLLATLKEFEIEFMLAAVWKEVAAGAGTRSNASAKTQVTAPSQSEPFRRQRFCSRACSRQAVLDLMMGV